jgi:proline racemase
MSELRVIDSRALRGPKTTVSVGGETDLEGNETKPPVVQYVEWHRDPVRGRVVVVPATDTAKSREVVAAPTKPEALAVEVERARQEIEKDGGGPREPAIVKEE